MSDHGSQGGGFAITPEEDRFLRAFFRRHAARYMVAMGLLVALAVWGAPRSDTGVTGPSEEQSEELAALRAGNEQLRAANEELRAELTQLMERVAALGAAPGSAPALDRLEERMASALTRLERVESHAAASAASGPSVELGAVLDRVYNLEARQDRGEKSRETFEKSVLNRLYAVESQRDSLAEASTSTQQSILERIGALEARAHGLERSLTGEGSARLAPAAPAP